VSDQATERRGLFRLIADVPALIVQLFRDELESLKLELTKKVKGVAIGAGLIAVAAVFAFLMLIMLLIAAVFALAQVVPTWAAALIVAGGLLIIAVVLILIGMAQFKKGDPGKVAESVKKDVNTIKGIGKRD
jgi:cytochrome c biogenesis protein CcdA